MRVSKDALSNLEQSSGEAPMKKLRLVEDQVIAEEEMVADPPLRHRRKRRRRVEGETPRARRTRDDATTTPVPDSEMETETDMEVTEVDDNFNTEMGLHPERDATDPRQRELEILGKRERESQEIEERLHNLGGILCKK